MPAQPLPGECRPKYQVSKSNHSILISRHWALCGIYKIWHQSNMLLEIRSLILQIVYGHLFWDSLILSMWLFVPVLVDDTLHGLRRLIVPLFFTNKSDLKRKETIGNDGLWRLFLEWTHPVLNKLHPFKYRVKDVRLLKLSGRFGVWMDLPSRASRNKHCLASPTWWHNYNSKIPEEHTAK